jgi:hypothetical protein
MKKIFLIIFALGGLSLLLNTGCSLTIGERQVAVQSPPPPPPAKPAPPPWAPAHGYRVKYVYYYYPEVQVYFDVGRRIYFYYQAGAWQVSANLPSGIRIIANEYVSLEMDVDRPYVHHHHVVKHYPPGHFKKHKDKGKGKKGD